MWYSIGPSKLWKLQPNSEAQKSRARVVSSAGNSKWTRRPAIGCSSRSGKLTLYAHGFRARRSDGQSIRAVRGRAGRRALRAARRALPQGSRVELPPWTRLRRAEGRAARQVLRGVGVPRHGGVHGGRAHRRVPRDGQGRAGDGDPRRGPVRGGLGVIDVASGGAAGVLAAIGRTPVARLQRLPAEAAEVWVKLEGANPTGSYKDRMALAMIEGAERDGRLKPGQTVVEYTGGSTGSSLALVCALKGYPLRIVTSDAFAVEKLATMQALGAELEVVSSPEGITPQLLPTLMGRAAEIREETGGFATDQLRNADMLDGYRMLGRELLEQLDGRLDAFCAYVGTSGCFVGTTRELRGSHPALHRVIVEPAESPAISEGRAGTHRIEGGGAGFWPPLLERDDFDEVVVVSTEKAFAMARRAAGEDGVF